MRPVFLAGFALLINAEDLGRGELRDFAMKDIKS